MTVNPKNLDSRIFTDVVEAIKAASGETTDTGVARLLGLSPGDFGNRKERGTIPYRQVIAWATKAGVSLDSLFVENTETTPALPKPVSEHDLTPADLEHYIKINRYAVEANAGAGALVLDEAVIDQLTFKRGWMLSKGWRARNLALLQVRGDSMEPTLMGGDLILINSDYGPLRDGLYVIRLGGGVMAKRLRFIGHDLVEVISDNKEVYAPFQTRLDAVDGLVVIGEIVWFCRELR